MELQREVDPESVVVIDHGTRYTKFGLSTDSAPHKVRTVVGYPIRDTPGWAHLDESYIGDEAIARRFSGPLRLKHPYNDGRIQNYEDIEKIWKYVFKFLNVDPKKAVLLLTQSNFGHPNDTKQMVARAFQSLDVAGLIVCNKSVLPLYQTDKMTGLIIDSGEEFTYVAAVYQGHPLEHRVLPNSLAGARVSDFFANELLKEDRVLSNEALYKLKETHAYVSATNQQAVSNNNPVFGRLSDGTQIIFKNGVATKGPELLFDPTLGGEVFSGLHQFTRDLIQMCPADERKHLVGHIVLSGGNTMLRGFPARFEQEIKELFPEYEDINVVAPSDRDFGAWRGACELSKQSNFFQQCVSAYEYDVEGEVVGLYKYDYGTSQSEASSLKLSP